MVVNCPLIDLNYKFTWPLYTKYGHAYDAFKAYMKFVDEYLK